MAKQIRLDWEELAKLEVASTDNINFKMGDLLGRWCVIYFYPKDLTSGCTTEGQDFRDYFAEFASLGVDIYGVSRDNLSLHEKFKEKHDFPFALLSDSEEKLCQAFDVIKEKKNFGKTYMGIVRSTFLLNAEGEVVKSWRNVKVKGHVQAVLEATRELKKDLLD